MADGGDLSDSETLRLRFPGGNYRSSKEGAATGVQFLRRRVDTLFGAVWHGVLTARCTAHERPFRHIELCKCAYFRAACTGMRLGEETGIMANVFAAGSELVRWEVTAVREKGPYRLGVYHAGGAIVEYFCSVPQALQRERELENLFTGARGLASSTSSKMAVGQ